MNHKELVRPVVVTFVERDADRMILSRGRIGIALGVGTKFVYTVALLDGWGYRIHRVPFGRFEEDFRPLYEYVAGVPNLERPYDIQKAARAFLKAGKQRAGITPAAEQHLTNLVTGKAVQMTDIEQEATEQQSEEATATKPKRAKKAAATKAPKGKTAPAKKEKKEAAPAKKATKAKANGERDPGRPSNADPTKIINVKVKENPRREGSMVYENFKLVLKYNGKPLGKYLDAGGRLDMIKDDILRKYVALGK